MMGVNNTSIAKHEAHLKLLKQAATSRMLKRRKSRRLSTRRLSTAGNHSSTTTFLSVNEPDASDFSQYCPPSAQPTIDLRQRSGGPSFDVGDNSRTYQVALKNECDTQPRPTLTECQSSSTPTSTSLDHASLKSVVSSWESSIILTDEEVAVGFNKSYSMGSIESVILAQSMSASSLLSMRSVTLPTSIQFKSWSLESSTQKMAEIKEAVHRNIKQELNVLNR